MYVCVCVRVYIYIGKYKDTLSLRRYSSSTPLKLNQMAQLVFSLEIQDSVFVLLAFFNFYLAASSGNLKTQLLLHSIGSTCFRILALPI